jgi:hypothetical protein
LAARANSFLSYRQHLSYSFQYHRQYYDEAIVCSLLLAMVAFTLSTYLYYRGSTKSWQVKKIVQWIVALFFWQIMPEKREGK